MDIVFIFNHIVKTLWLTVVVHFVSYTYEMLGLTGEHSYKGSLTRYRYFPLHVLIGDFVINIIILEYLLDLLVVPFLPLFIRRLIIYRQLTCSR